MSFYTWQKVSDPATGWKGNKTSGWTADDFDTNNLLVTFDVPEGTAAVMCVVRIATTASASYWRSSGDTNIAEHPNASSEYSHLIGNLLGDYHVAMHVNTNGAVQITVANTGTDIYVSYPYMILR